MSAVLTLLRIRNLALVEELEWQVEPGFVAVTGETGAGKSIIIGALQLLLGERTHSKKQAAASVRMQRAVAVRTRL
jgi:DNA repair ATPase RecN